MKASWKPFLVASFLAPLAAHAIKVPVPVEGVNLNLGVNVQTHVLFNENGTPDGGGWSSDVFMRRTRLAANGDVSKYFWFFFQVDNTNFGKYGSFTGRMVVQDAVFAWGPTGTTGSDVLLIEAGIIRIPSTRGTITNVNNNFTVDGHPDLIRGFNGNFFNANRSTGVEVRGWALNKKIGFRGGPFLGVKPSAADLGLNTKTYPLLAGIVNFNFLGTQEGGFSYETIYFAKEPLLSISLGGGYQSQAVRVAKGVSDFKTASTTAYLEYPFSEDAEVIAIFNGYRHSMGTGSRDTGWGWSADLAYRFKWVRPYATWEMFTSDDCPTDATELTGAALATCLTSRTAGAHTADSRNFRAGLDFYFNKTLNHLMIEFSSNHGQSGWGPQSITTATAGYVPLSLDPSAAGRPRRPMDTLLASPSQKSVLMQWAVVF
ncbi:MAG TPA: hypothetical protein VFP21_02400 [Solirubrobacterales bacterium]|nr:hypothetical protein [Solirubrobacterales bacterium]